MHLIATSGCSTSEIVDLSGPLPVGDVPPRPNYADKWAHYCTKGRQPTYYPKCECELTDDEYKLRWQQNNGGGYGGYEISVDGFKEMWPRNLKSDDDGRNGGFVFAVTRPDQLMARKMFAEVGFDHYEFHNPIHAGGARHFHFLIANGNPVSKIALNPNAPWRLKNGILVPKDFL